MFLLHSNVTQNSALLAYFNTIYLYYFVGDFFALFGATLYDELQCFAEQLDKKVRELYDVVCRLEDEKYDWEMKLIRQNAEVRITIVNNNNMIIK